MEVAGKRLDDNIVSELCEPCHEGNVSTQADGYCNDCAEYMCQTRFQSHVKMKVLRNHVLGALDAGRKQGSQSQAEKCKKHTTENIKYYCRNHDSVACVDCLLFDHRKCEPEPEFIRDLAKKIEESYVFKNILKELESLEDFKAEVELALGRNRKENTEFHDKAIHEIQTCRAEINTWLDNVTSKLEAEEMEIWKENEIILSKLEDWITIINDMIDEDSVRVDLEKELEQLRITTCEEKKEKEILQQSYDKLKKELEEQGSFISREREERDKYVLQIKELEKRIALLKQEVSSLNDLNTSLKSQLDSRNKEFDVLESTYKARQEQDHSKIQYLQSELKKIRSFSENHEKECKRLSSQIQDLQSKSAEKTYRLPDPRAAGFDVGKRVKSMFQGWTGTVTAIDPSGYVDVKWDNRSVSYRYRAGAGGAYHVKLL